VNPNLAVIFDEPQFPEAIHKKTHSGSRCANHLRQDFLTDLWNYRLGLAFLAELGEQQENSRQPLFAGIEKLINQSPMRGKTRKGETTMSGQENRNPQHSDPQKSGPEKPGNQPNQPTQQKPPVPTGQPKTPQPEQEKHDQQKKKPA
jgi:hypothetical protein